MPARNWHRLSSQRVTKKKKNVLVPCPTCNSMSHKLSTKLTKRDKESRLDVDNQTETKPLKQTKTKPSSSIRLNGVGTHRVIRSTCHCFELRPGKSARSARACLR